MRGLRLKEAQLGSEEASGELVQYAPPFLMTEALAHILIWEIPSHDHSVETVTGSQTG